MPTLPGSLRWPLGLLALVTLLGGCALEVQNRQPAQAVAAMAAPTGSVYTGWRVFQDKCASCHGAAATGSATGPDLLPRLRQLGERSFASLVLKRYEWHVPATEAVLEDVLKRQETPMTMPAWQGEPRVNAHIADLYVYLSARAEGRQGPGKPSL